jgi:hypothetical protein
MRIGKMKSFFNGGILLRKSSAVLAWKLFDSQHQRKKKGKSGKNLRHFFLGRWNGYCENGNDG